MNSSNNFYAIVGIPYPLFLHKKCVDKILMLYSTLGLIICLLILLFISLFPIHLLIISFLNYLPNFLSSAFLPKIYLPLPLFSRILSLFFSLNLFLFISNFQLPILLSLHNFIHYSLSHIQNSFLIFLS